MPDKFMIKIIFIGDIVGKIGRRAVARHLPKIRKKYQPDLVLANAENLAHGIGFTEKSLAEVKAAGVDLFTTGNHAWHRPGHEKILNQKDHSVIRPANILGRRAGVGFKIFNLNRANRKIGLNKIIVVNLLGREMMKEKASCPFRKIDKILISQRSTSAIFLVDFHAELVSEKIAFGHYVDGRVAAVFGTHTHVPSADQRILSGGTAFVTDAGMVGYYDSVIGARKEVIIDLFLGRGRGAKKHDLPASGWCQFNAVYLALDPKTGQAREIKRLDKLIKVD